MKKILFFCLSVVVVLTTLGVCTSLSKETGLTNADYLRIHIRANSNTTEDQNIKYAIKDEFVEYLTPKLAECGTKQSVMDMILKETVSLENLANNTLIQNGFDYSARVIIDKENFPTRTYEGYTLESGIYDAIIVELGTATGNNWWCVIYPPLCFVNYTSESSKTVVYKSKLWEIIKQFFN
jgi:stage II sporulation protein R